MSVSASLSGQQGPARVLALEGDRPEDLLAVDRHGLPFTALEAIASQLDLPSAEIGVLLGIPQRTFARRRKTLLLTSRSMARSSAGLNPRLEAIATGFNHILQLARSRST